MKLLTADEVRRIALNNASGRVRWRWCDRYSSSRRQFLVNVIEQQIDGDLSTDLCVCTIPHSILLTMLTGAANVFAICESGPPVCACNSGNAR